MLTTTLFSSTRATHSPLDDRAVSLSIRNIISSLAIATVSTGLFAMSASAELRDYTVRWLPSASSGVEGYELSVGVAPGEYDSKFDLGLPAQQNGELRFPMELEGSVDLHLTLRAYGAGQASPLSNEIVVAAVEAPTDPGEPNFGVSGFEGVTGVVSGSIVVTAETFGAAESVRFVLDGVSYRVENVAPWSLAGDAGEPGTEHAFDTTTLTDGEHTLEATAFSADAASGVAGASYSLTFAVDNNVAAPTPDPTPSPSPAPSPSPSPDPSPEPGPVAGPEGAVAGLYSTADGDIVALRVDGSTTTLTRNDLAMAGDLRPVWCDLDGDEDNDLVVGFGPGSGAQVLVLMIEDLEVVEEQILLTAWKKYRLANGETYPGCGDVDGDQRNELAIGLGGGSLASIVMLDDRDSGFQRFDGGKRGQVLTMPGMLTLGMDYARDGAAKPVLGDIDGDGRDEIVVGRSEGGRATVSILDDAAHGFKGIEDLRSTDGLLEVVPDEAYQTDNGATEIAVGDIDGDGLDEIVVGTGVSGGSRLFVYDDAERGFKVLADSAEGLEFGHADYNALTGALKPTLADIDGDGLPEVALGFGAGGEGQIQLLDDLLTEFAPLSWTGDAEGMVAAPSGAGAVSSALEVNSR